MDDSYLEPEFEPHYLSWKANPTPDNTSHLIKAINPVLSAAQRTYGIPGSPTMASRAKALALDAVGKYDPTKAKLRTHLMFQLQGLRRYAAKESQILSVPEQVALDYGHLRDSENELKDRLGRDPSDTELADHMKLSIKRIHYIRKMSPTYSEGSYQRPTEDGEDIYTPAISTPSDVGAWHEFVYHDLTPIDQVIMEHSLGLHGKKILSNQDIARRLKLSPGAISQRKAQIQAKLDLREELGVI